MALLDLSDIDAGYGNVQILDGVDLEVAEGEYVVIIGPNGAGKSTVMKTITGLATQMGGTVRFNGEDISGIEPASAIRNGLSYIPQRENIFPSLTVRENLEMGAYIYDDVPTDRLEEIWGYFPVLEERQNQTAEKMSGGQQQMLAIGRALMVDPDLILLDEPSAGLAPEFVDEVFDRIDAVNDHGTAVLMVEQNAEDALRHCDRAYVLVQGTNRFTGTGEELLGDDELRQEFLGV